jgi:hypothetical protein
MTSKLILSVVPIVAVGLGSLTFRGGPAAVPLGQVELRSADNVLAREADRPGEGGELLAQVYIYSSYRYGVVFNVPPGYRYDGYRYSGYRYDGYRYDGYRYDGYRYDGYRYSAYRYDGYRYDGYRYSAYRYDDYRYGYYRYAGYRYNGYR